MRDYANYMDEEEAVECPSGCDDHCVGIVRSPGCGGAGSYGGSCGALDCSRCYGRGVDHSGCGCGCVDEEVVDTTSAYYIAERARCEAILAAWRERTGQAPLPKVTR